MLVSTPEVTTFKGINNVSDSSKIKYDTFIDAKNIVVTKNGSIVNRDGYTKVLDGNFSNLFSSSLGIIGKQDDNLVLITSTYEIITLATNFTQSILDYVEVASQIFIADGANLWVIKDFKLYHIKDLFEENRFNYSPMVGGHIVTYFANRLFVASKNVVYYSNPMDIYRTLLHANFIPFESSITMLAPVSNGMFVSDMHNIYFLKGRTPSEFIQIPVYDSPAYFKSDYEVSKFMFGSQAIIQNPYIVGKGVIFTTPKSICVGFDENNFFPLTETYYQPLLNADTAPAVVKDDTYITIAKEA